MVSMDRRRWLKSMGAVVAMGAAGAMVVRGMERPAYADPPPGCPIGWRPNALAPVFYGQRHYFSVHGAPVPVQVFFPSLDGAPASAQILTGCGRYPLILFAHGQCADPDHYRRWTHLPAQLARSGYVVAVPQLLGIGNPSYDGQTTATLAAVGEWMRDGWKYRATLQPPPATGLVGHSFGALHIGQLATRAPVAAVASLSGVWQAWDPGAGQNPILAGDVPRLFTWGTGGFDGEHDAVLPGPLWNAVAAPKHRAVFTGAQHFDYLPANVPVPCRTVSGDCAHVGAAVADLATLFFARYLPPEGMPGLPGKVPHRLVPPPPLSLTHEQQQYAGGHLTGWDQYQDQDCAEVQVTYRLPDTVVPDVRGLDVLTAKFTLENAGLAVKAVIPGGPGPGLFVVVSQSPAPGASVPQGSTVTLVLRAEDIEL